MYELRAEEITWCFGTRVKEVTTVHWSAISIAQAQETSVISRDGDFHRGSQIIKINLASESSKSIDQPLLEGILKKIAERRLHKVVKQRTR